MLEPEIVRFNLLISHVVYSKVCSIPVSELVELRDHYWLGSYSIILL